MLPGDLNTQSTSVVSLSSQRAELLLQHQPEGGSVAQVHIVYLILCSVCKPEAFTLCLSAWQHHSRWPLCWPWSTRTSYTVLTAKTLNHHTHTVMFPDAWIYTTITGYLVLVLYKMWWCLCRGRQRENRKKRWGVKWQTKRKWRSRNQMLSGGKATEKGKGTSLNQCGLSLCYSTDPSSSVLWLSLTELTFSASSCTCHKEILGYTFLWGKRIHSGVGGFWMFQMSTRFSPGHDITNQEGCEVSRIGFYWLSATFLELANYQIYWRDSLFPPSQLSQLFWAIGCRSICGCRPHNLAASSLLHRWFMACLLSSAISYWVRQKAPERKMCEKYCDIRKSYQQPVCDRCGSSVPAIWSCFLISETLITEGQCGQRLGWTVWRKLAHAHRAYENQHYSWTRVLNLLSWTGWIWPLASLEIRLKLLICITGYVNQWSSVIKANPSLQPVQSLSFHFRALS